MVLYDQLAGRWLAGVERRLEGREWIACADFTVADAYCFTILNWTNFHGIDLTALPNVSAYVSRVAARPKVQQAMREEGLIQ